MKKFLTIIFVLLFLTSLGFNGFFAYKLYFAEEDEVVEEEYFIKYNKKEVSKDDYIKDTIEHGSDSYLLQLMYTILYDDLSKEEIEEVSSTVEDTIDELNEKYGSDEIESTISSSLGTNLENYKKMITVHQAYTKRLSSSCQKNPSTTKCNNKLLEEQYNVIKDTEIKFDNKNLKEKWNNYIETAFDSIINPKEEPEEPVVKPTEEDPTSNLKEVDYQEFKTMLNNQDNFLIIFSQTGCSHCKDFKPKINKIAKENKFIVYYLEIDKIDSETYNTFKDEYDFTGTPTTFVVKKGIIKDKIVGNVTDEQLSEFLKNNEYIK